jgi:hypothetical protein
MERRDFLRGIALGAVTAGSPIVLAPGSAFAADDASAPSGGYYPGTVYADGNVLLRTANSLALVHPELGMTEVSLSAKTSVWKGVHATADVIRVGDHLSLRGYRLADGTIDAVAIWANIAWRRGTVSEIAGAAVSLHTAEGSPDLFHVAAHTAMYRGAEPAQSFSGQLRVGHQVEALGSSETPDAVLVASRVWIA